MKRGQAWGFDLIIGILIFLAGVLFFYFYTINYQGDEGSFRALHEQATLVSDSLLSEGSPVNWNKTNVVRIGLITDGKVNDTKLAMFYELARDEYENTKVLFRVRDDYYVYFDMPLNFSGEVVSGIGLQEFNQSNLAKVTRVVVYNNTIESMNLHLWN